MDKLLLIDGSGFIFRAYFSIPPMKNANGVPVNAVYGFCKMILKICEDNPSNQIAVILDSSRKTFRQDIYPEYKANRPPPPDDLIPQFDLIRQAIAAFNLPMLELSGYEADDIIATLAVSNVKKGSKVDIISSDKDLAQLVSDDITLVDPKDYRRINKQEVIQKFGVTPEMMIDYQSLVGDSSDNIPGISGIGPKTAVNLLNTFGNLNNIYDNIDNIEKVRIRDKLINSKDIAYVSKELVTLKKDVPLSVGEYDFNYKIPNNDKLLKFLQDNGFKSLIAKLPKIVGQLTKATEKSNLFICADYENETTFDDVTKDNTIQELKKLQIGEVKDYLKKLSEYHEVTVYLDYGINKLDSPLCLFLANSNLGVFAIERDLINNQEVLFEVQKFFENKSIAKIFLDGKRAILQLMMLNIDVNGIQDISIMAYLCNNLDNNSDINFLINKYIGLEIKEEKDLFSQQPHKLIVQYAYYLQELYHILKAELLNKGLWNVYTSIDLPMVKAVAKMEKVGVLIDINYFSEINHKFRLELDEVSADIYSLAGQEFNLASPKQLGAVLFNDMQLKKGKKSKTGNYSTNAEVLEKMAAEGIEIADKILKWRTLHKLITTYSEALPKEIDKITGRIHTTYNITETTTGRFSSIKPNLQNIPVKGDMAKELRKGFIAEEGSSIISCDYSQIELRLLAHVADMKSLKEAFAKDIDVHSLTSTEIFKKDISEITSDERRFAKTVNFGLIYGMSKWGLAKQLGISPDEAQGYIDAYFKRYPGMNKYVNDTKEFLREHGFVHTPWWRRCYIQGIDSNSTTMRSNAERAGVNAPLQGGAADIMKMALYDVSNLIEEEKLPLVMIMQVHDELVFQSPKELAEELSKKVVDCMEKVVKLSVPLKVDYSINSYWE